MSINNTEERRARKLPGQYRYILFDLDGTLTDSAPGIVNSVRYALGKMGVDVGDEAGLVRFVGPPLIDSFQEYYGFSEKEALRAISAYREYFRDKGIFENVVYEGIEELLQLLKDKKKTLLVATAKPEIFARQVLDHFGLSGFFKVIAGSELDGTRVHKDEVIRYALERYGKMNLNDAIMVGDRKHDILGAKKVGLASIGVLFGYGSREELESAAPDYLVESVQDLALIFGD